ncbi:hypothetical protein E2562_007534 [Oryza meyeriana var. granulata]|uniref:Uncharacterized protein n=1 Tax=Oryza meyeriana var. granulata TaxID=110450 RepID=A0A6G1DVK1_9ORYZ|nr:hypothetical protein E2562_007534 [Oryza meyeriana var. granulata]
MAHYQEVDYCSEEVRSVTPAGGYLHHGGGGVQQHVVKETFQEVDRSGRRAGHHHHGPDHLVVRETRVEDDVNTCTGEVHERKQSFLFRSD